jgi:SAM-dependent methyltransferase
MPDAVFAEPRLAEIYDALDPDRSDLDAYAAIAAELGARTVLDIGCGTGTLACLLDRRGLQVTGIDPARASLDVARRKPGAGHVRWLHGDATAVPPLRADLATMTGNVAQLFLSARDWAAALRAARQALRPGGWLVFESRDPAKRAWREWTREHTHRRVAIPGAGPVETWTDLTRVDGSLVSFRTTYVFHAGETVLVSDSTLRFPDRGELAASVAAAGLDVVEVRDAPDRPGLEFVFLAQRPYAGRRGTGGAQAPEAQRTALLVSSATQADPPGLRG